MPFIDLSESEDEVDDPGLSKEYYIEQYNDKCKQVKQLQDDLETFKRTCLEEKSILQDTAEMLTQEKMDCHDERMQLETELKITTAENSSLQTRLNDATAALGKTSYSLKPFADKQVGDLMNYELLISSNSNWYYMGITDLMKNLCTKQGFETIKDVASLNLFLKERIGDGLKKIKSYKGKVNGDPDRPSFVKLKEYAAGAIEEAKACLSDLLDDYNVVFVNDNLNMFKALTIVGFSVGIARLQSIENCQSEVDYFAYCKLNALIDTTTKKEFPEYLFAKQVATELSVGKDLDTEIERVFTYIEDDEVEYISLLES